MTQQKEAVNVSAPLTQEKTRVSPHTLSPTPALAALPTPATQPAIMADNTPQKGKLDTYFPESKLFCDYSRMFESNDEVILT